MSFEILANELLLNLFEYLSSVDLLKAFYNLNGRLNGLVLRHFQNHCLNFQSISKSSFDIVCEKYLPSIIDRITSLCLSDDDDTPNQIDLFFSYGYSFCQFSHLHALSIYHIYSSYTMNKVIAELNYLPHLKYLKINRHTLVYNDMYDVGIIDLIRRLHRLSYCYLDIINDNDCCFLTPPIVSSSLKHLYLPCLDCSINQLINLTKHVPYLQTLNVRIVDYSTSLQVPSVRFLSMNKLKFIFSGTVIALKNLVQAMPNITDLKADMESTYIDGYQLKSIIESYLPRLVVLKFKMSTTVPSQNIDQDEKIDEILNSFRSRFWTQEHLWFVQCYWISTNTSSIIYVYTLPYAFHDFFYIGNIRLKSTFPNDNQYWSFNSIHNLYYGRIPCQNLSFSHIQLDKINYLDLTIPHDDSLWLIVPTFERLNSLNVVSYHSMDTCDMRSNLQILFDRSPHLYSLKFFSWFSQEKFPFDVQHPSIRKLDLQGPSIVYNQEQCLQLSRSFIGQQCEVLFINVKEPMDIIELINNMKNLRVLIVQCIKATVARNKHENLIDWLKDRLPVTCSISNCTEVNNAIRLWLR